MILKLSTALEKCRLWYKVGKVEECNARTLELCNNGIMGEWKNVSSIEYKE